MFSETDFLIICGDLNAQTDVLNDYLSEDEVSTNEWLNSLNFDQELVKYLKSTKITEALITG